MKADFDLRKVILYFCGGGCSEHIVKTTDLAKFIEASQRLHYEPGINPHNGKVTARLSCIEVSKLVSGGPYWWSTPSLKENGDPDGVEVFFWVPCFEEWRAI